MQPLLIVRPLVLAIFAVATILPGVAQEAGFPVPRFRHVESAAKPPAYDKSRKLVLLADDDFAPFSYSDTDGQVRGLAVDTARAVCTQLELQCEIRATSWSTLAETLKTADAAISGLKVSEPVLAGLEPTRPFYRAMARFAVRKDSPVKTPDPVSLDDKRVGVVKGSAHATWLKTYFQSVALVEFNDLGAAEEALRKTEIDAVFADALQLVYWTKGSAAQNCCHLVGGAFVDADYFSPGFSFFVKRGDRDLKAAFDYGLDRLQDTGEFAKIFRIYVPASPW